MNPPRRLLSALAVTAAAALTLAACSSGGSNGPSDAGGDASSPELTTLKVATIGLTSDGALIAGIEQGFFEEEGLEIETSIVANPPAGLAAVQSGQVDIAYAPSIPLLNALSQGVPIQVVAAADGFDEEALDSDDPSQFDDTGLFAAPGSGVETVADLAGKTISVPARSAQLEVVIAGELLKAGIDPANGVNWVVLDFTSAVSALQSGTVDAAGLVNPFTDEAAANGATLISSPSIGFFETGAVGLWTVGTSTVEAKGDAIAAFQRAITKANRFAMDNPDVAIQAGLDYTDSQLSLDEVKRPFWPVEVRESDIDRPNQKMVELGFLAEPVDLSGVIFTAR